MENEELAEMMLALAEQSIAISDVMSIICAVLSAQDGKAANAAADTLEAISKNPALEMSQAFVALSGRLAQALRGDPNMALLGVKKSDLFQSSTQELQHLIRRLKGDGNPTAAA